MPTHVTGLWGPGTVADWWVVHGLQTFTQGFELGVYSIFKHFPLESTMLHGFELGSTAPWVNALIL